MESRDKIRITAISLVVIIAIGTIGYSVLEGWKLLESLYMTVITLTTVGFSEVHPIERSATRVFTIALIIAGMGVVFYALSTLTQVVVEGQIRELLGRRRLKNRIDALVDHTIVCGFGRIGQSICMELVKSKVRFVVIDSDPMNMPKIEKEHYLGIIGDATSEDVLEAAGIQRARSLIPAASTDADNVYITLTARSINPKLLIVARAAELGADKKLTWAGADRVVSPYQMSGRRMANLLLRPNVVEFIEGSLYDASVDLAIEELHLPRQSTLAGKSVKSSGLRKDYGLSIVAIKRLEGGLVVNPSPDDLLENGDVLIVLGKRSELEKIARAIDATEIKHNYEAPLEGN